MSGGLREDVGYISPSGVPMVCIGAVLARRTKNAADGLPCLRHIPRSLVRTALLNGRRGRSGDARSSCTRGPPLVGACGSDRRDQHTNWDLDGLRGSTGRSGELVGTSHLVDAVDRTRTGPTAGDCSAIRSKGHHEATCKPYWCVHSGEPCGIGTTWAERPRRGSPNPVRFASWMAIARPAPKGTHRRRDAGRAAECVARGRSV